MGAPSLTFFCELDPPQLGQLIDTPQVLAAVKKLDAGISLAIRDLSAERAALVKRIERAGIPLTAWLVLPQEQGYWFNAGNSAEAVRLYDEFRRWTQEHSLHWQRVGLDIEPHIAEMQGLYAGRWLALLPTIWDRLFNPERIWHAEAVYQGLIERIHADGWGAEVYHMPLIVDERMAGSRLIRALGGLVDVKGDIEVLMLYSSFLRPHGAAFLWSYGPYAQAIGVGSTGGGVEIAGTVSQAPLSWEELERDLLLAHRWSHQLYIFSLEGCVQQGYLSRLADIDWHAGLPAVPDISGVERFRKGLRAALWVSNHPWLTLAGFAALLWLLTRRRRR